MEKSERDDLKAVVFFCETVLHLNPTRMDGGTVRAYMGCVERVKQTHPEVFGAVEEVPGGQG